jgi:hypothetical protein
MHMSTQNIALLSPDLQYPRMNKEWIMNGSLQRGGIWKYNYVHIHFRCVIASNSDKNYLDERITVL